VKQRNGKFVLYLLFCFVVTIILLLIFHEPILLAIGNFLIIRDQLQPADVIQVISGLDHRTNYAIQLYKQGYGKILFYTGGWCAEIQGVHAVRSTQMSLNQGVPIDAIASDAFQVTSTFGEAERLKLWIDQANPPVRSIMIVSDPHHMRRAQWAYQQIFGNDVKLIMAPVPIEQTPFIERWWTDRETLTMVGEEYVKMIYYYARYKLSSGPLQDWLASFDKE
jgi:uncharacterized SAM-binding protein YcdF (DUF218 family)